MAHVRDLYDVLGVGRDASQDDIRKAYRQLARRMHPDVNGSPEAEESFKEISGAYEILSDPQRRRQYDMFGTQSGPGGSPFGDVQDIFDFFFGQGGFGARRRSSRRSRAERGEDVFVRVRLSFEDAAFGAHRDLELQRLEPCPRCLGNGAEPGTAPTTCRTCGGRGEIQEVRRSIFGQLVTSGPCPSCRATGLEISDPCTECEGEGRIAASHSVPVDVPAGVTDGLELRVPAGGHAGRAGGPAGDLYLRMSVDPSETFERRGEDLHALLDISMTQAALGTEVQIQTLDGTESVRIDPGTESGAVLRLRGKGIPNLSRRGRGDLYLSVRVRTASELGRDERELLERLAELRGEAAGRGSKASVTLRHPTES